MQPQNMPLWYKDYFVRKEAEKKQIQKSSLPSPYMPKSRAQTY